MLGGLYTYLCECMHYYVRIIIILLTLGAHAQRRLQYMVSVSVCLCVYYYSRTTGYEAAYERYLQLQCYKDLKINVTILLKRLRSRDMA